RPMRFIERTRVLFERRHISLPQNRRLTQPRTFAFQSADAQPVLEGELHLIVIEHAQRDHLVMPMSQTRQRAAQLSRIGEGIGQRRLVSSSYSRTYGRSVRASTRQSSRRGSSPATYARCWRNSTLAPRIGLRCGPVVAPSTTRRAVSVSDCSRSSRGGSR